MCMIGMVSLEMSEAMSIKEALSLIKNRGWQSIIVESDCLVVKQEICSMAPLISTFGHVIEDCRNMI